jgi:hypothetical protein
MMVDTNVSECTAAVTQILLANQKPVGFLYATIKGKHMAKKKKVIKKFEDIKPGQMFQELRDENPRKFIRLQDTLPSGIKIEYHVFGQPVQDEHWKDEAGKDLYLKDTRRFNSVDTKGIMATCPDWVEFEVLE